MTRPPPFALQSSLTDDKASGAMLQIIESSVEVKRRYQFFVWTQARLSMLLPHQLAICGLYQRTTKELAFEVFNSVAVAPSLLALLTDFRSAMMQQAIGAWLERGHAVIVELDGLAGERGHAERSQLADAGIVELLVHGVSRPQRPAELESLFIFASTGSQFDPTHLAWLDMLLPHVHSTYLRTQATEREMTGTPPAPKPAVPRRAQQRLVITEREKQILGWVREGKSNLQIGGELGISPLTVKNHLQKILRKLTAVNRAQAVAKAMSMGILERSSGFAALDFAEE